MGIREDNKNLREYAESLSVQEYMRSRGRMEVDQAIYTSQQLENRLTDQIDRKKELLQSLRAARKSQISVEQLRNTVGTLLNEQKNSDTIEYEYEKIELPQVHSNWDEFVEENRKFAEKYGIDISNPYKSMFSGAEFVEVSHQLAEQFDLLRLDKYDYAFATFTGVINGIIDVVFVGTIGNKTVSKLQGVTDKAVEEMVKKYARLRGWNDNDKRNDKSKIRGEIGFLEKLAPVPYDARYYQDLNLNIQEKKLSASNHRLRSLAHSPTILGLIIGVLDILNNTTTIYIPEKGIQVINNPTNGNGVDVKNIFEAIERWFTHLMSDVAGTKNSETRGSGIPAPFQEIFQQFQFGKIKIKDKEYTTVGGLTEELYKNGYDFRAFLAQGIPVIINEALIRIYWFCKQHFYFGRPINESVPIEKSRELHRLLVVSGAVFSSIDLTGSVGKNLIKSKNLSPLTFFLSMNYVQLGDFGFHVYTSMRLNMEHRKEIRDYIKNNLRDEWELMCKNDI